MRIRKIAIALVTAVTLSVGLVGVTAAPVQARDSSWGR